MYAVLGFCSIWMLYNFIAELNNLPSIDLFINMHYLLAAVESVFIKWCLPISVFDIGLVIAWFCMKRPKDSPLNEISRWLMYVTIVISIGVFI